ncbi:CubicO group peptidase, beta-lactamase class C family [Pseudarcicella hirudinis]|uniref:CubicO group peptidase, beta-lactamase class C family n=1 Tax=Pseudarcicella hirudinis TaxID=1079859 RepID=A0A1I5Y295_9BACT|nr:serine hydrolase [Pseudarcicella hirudinis]SFQ38315.1 CubicO group peptidase, beta-lactamase class C family [Pseudarcicella hirudinis]
MCKIPFIFLILFFSIVSGNNLLAQLSPTKVKQLDSLLEAAHQIGVFNGNALVSEHGKIVYHAETGYANGSKTVKLSPDHCFDIGSISKEFNSVGIMLLQEKGKLKLSDKLSKYFPELPAWAEKIQLKHLLQYTSGLPNSKALSDTAILKEISLLKNLQFEPGTAFDYNISNVYLQRAIIQKITGISYSRFVETFLLKPCKMDQSYVDKPGINTITAIPFDNNFRETIYQQNMTGWVRLPAEDLFRWAQCLNSYKIISENSFKELSEGFPNSETSLGGTKYENGKLIWHQHHGSNYNYEALMYSNLQKDITIILMTNNQNFKVHALKDAILAILEGQPYKVPKKSIYLDIREKVLNNFEQGIAFLNQIKASEQNKYDFSGEKYDLVSTGKYLMRREHFDDAIKMFHLATLANPNKEDFSYAYELIAESYYKKGSKELAIIYYKKAVEVYSENKNAAGMLLEIAKGK